MSDEPTFEQQVQPPHGGGGGRSGGRSGGGGGCLKGLAIGCLVMVILAVVAGVVVVRNFKSIMTNAGGAMATAMIDDSQLPPEQKARLKTKLDTLLTDYKEGRIDTEQIGLVMQGIAEGPLLPGATVYYMGEQYVATSGFSDEDKAAANRAIDRFTRGVFEGKIPQGDIQSAVNQITVGSGQQGQQVKETLTDAELELFIETLKDGADAASIADEAYELDLAGEIEALIDKALASGATPGSTSGTHSGGFGGEGE